jgi:hypothetical protein
LLNQHQLEDYLTDDEFMRHFAMSRGEYKLLPAWKQQEKKKQVGLY